MDKYFYGDMTSPVNDVPVQPKIDRVQLREFLVSQLIPIFQGDNGDGILNYCRRLENYIING